MRFSGLLGLLLCCTTALANDIDLRVQGLDDKALADNIQAHARTLEPPASEQQHAEFAEQLQAKTAKALEPYGYYQAEIVPRYDSDAKRWLIEVKAGPRVQVAALNLALTGPGESDPALRKRLAASPLKVGQGLSHSQYENTKSSLQSLALTRGYFDFKYSQQSIRVNRSANSADISLIANTGPRYQFGELRIVGSDKAQDLVSQLQPFKPGDLYVAEQLATFSRDIKETQYFRSVLVRPLVQQAVNLRIPVEVTLVHEPRDKYEVGGGFSSDIGPRLRGKWRRPWANRYGHSMGADLFLSAPQQQLSFNYKVPIEDPVSNFASFQAGLARTDDNDTRSDRLTLAAQRHKDILDSDWQRIHFLRLERETFTQGIEAEETTTLLIPGFTLSRFRSRGGLDIYWGDRQRLTLETASESVLSDINLVRLTAQSSWLRSYGKHRFLVRGELGAIATNDFSQVPSSLRYFTGGDQSIRGFGFREIAPRDEIEGELIGGRYLATASIEYSYPVRPNWRAALFFDTGTATTDFDEGLARGIGTGVQWQSPIGPVRIYIARGHSQDEDTWRLHFSMGPLL